MLASSSSFRSIRSLCVVLVAGALFACSSDAEGDGNGGNGNTDVDGGSGGSDPAPFTPPTPDDCITDVSTGVQALNCEGLDFTLSVPAVCASQACGLIFDVHGFGMNAELMNLHSQMQALGEREGYIVVQPSAPGMVLQSAWSPDHDDQVWAILQRVVNVWHVDEKRIHFGGYSMGAWMTWRMICKHSDVIASAAPIAGGAQTGGCSFSGAETPAREIPIFYTHGRTDGLVQFSTAEQQRDNVINGWAMQESEVVMSGADHLWTRYENANGTVFEFAEHDWECGFMLGTLALRGHCFPGSKEFLGCGETNPWNWGEAVMQFYKDHPAP